MRFSAAALFGLSLLLFHPSAEAAGKRNSRPRAASARTEAGAKRIAESETGGTAVSARRIHLNGATCGWEVLVHMPREDRGWRCIVDCDAPNLHSRERIPNPPLKGRSSRR
ncbi:MAG: hypothetical protein HY823_04320 [Acidobacteria bacterium]|nr:hypothetical protein [Acidobacteriota bacterium]